MSLYRVPVKWQDARGFVREWHRHHKPPTGHVFSTGVASDGVLVGIATVGRPSARWFDDGLTLEVTRTATDGTKNANSMLYAACWDAAKGLGYQRLITYTQAARPELIACWLVAVLWGWAHPHPAESGASLRAAGWRVVAERKARRGWDTPSRRRDSNGNDGIPRTLWEAAS